MSYEEIVSLDADVVIALGKKDKKTGKAYPKEAEGYYLGSRVVEGKGDRPSRIHFLKTPQGPLGIWGTTDLNRKLLQARVGAMTLITSTGKKPTPNGDMYTYKVAQDVTQTIEVAISESAPTSYEDADEAPAEYEAAHTSYEDEVPEEETAAPKSRGAGTSAERQAAVSDLFKSKKK